MGDNAATLMSIDRELHAARDLPETPCRLTYILFASQRSGSNYLADFLRNTRLAGDPIEYLNARYIEVGLRRIGPPKASFQQYLRFWVKHRTSANGTFGMKVQPGHLRGDTKNEPSIDAFLSAIDRIVYLHRQDVLGQAISLFKAIETDAWTSKAERAAETSVAFDASKISKHVTNLLEEAEFFREVLQPHRDKTLCITYEDLDATPEAVFRRVLGFLDIDDPIDLQACWPRTKKQRNAQTDELRARYLATLAENAADPWAVSPREP